LTNTNNEEIEMTEQTDLQIEINGIVQDLKARYPELQQYNIIKRLIAAGDKWQASFAKQYPRKGA